MFDITPIAICTDCMQYLANDDLPPETDEARDQEIIDGFTRLNNDGFLVTVGDMEDGDEFSTQACEACGAKLHGERHAANLLQ